MWSKGKLLSIFRQVRPQLLAQGQWCAHQDGSSCQTLQPWSTMLGHGSGNHQDQWANSSMVSQMVCVQSPTAMGRIWMVWKWWMVSLRGWKAVWHQEKLLGHGQLQGWVSPWANLDGTTWPDKRRGVLAHFSNGLLNTKVSWNLVER